MATDFVKSGDLISDFTISCYSNNEITRQYEMKDDNVFRLDFGYKTDGLNRLLGTYLYRNDFEASAIIINNFAKEKFIEFMDRVQVPYKVLEE